MFPSHANADFLIGNNNFNEDKFCRIIYIYIYIKILIYKEKEQQ